MPKLLQLTIALISLILLTALTSPALATINSDYTCPYRGAEDPEVIHWLEEGVCDGRVDCSGQSGCLEAKAWCTPEQCATNGLGRRCGVCYDAPLRIVYLGNADGTPGQCPAGFSSDDYNDCFIEVYPNGGETPPLPAGRYYVYHRAGCWDGQEIVATEGCILSGSLPCKVIDGNGLTCSGGSGIITILCQAMEWKCRGKDVGQPAVVCYHGNPAQRSSCIPKEQEFFTCPTNKDAGQKDGTGKTGGDRVFNNFDYDSNQILNIPPLALPTPGNPTPFVTPPATGTPTPTPTIPAEETGIPCGWPTDSSHRVITNRCPNNECPETASECLDSSHDYNSVDIRGNLIPIYATMSGVATRYVAAIQTTASANYGVYVIIRNFQTGYQTLYAHLLPEPDDQVGDVTDLGEVEAGEQIGNALVDSSGFAAAPHLHYEVWQNNTRLCPNSFLDCQRSASAASPTFFQRALNALINLVSPLTRKNNLIPMPKDQP